MKSAAILVSALAAEFSATARAELLEEPVAGPMQICFKYSAFSLADGERIVGFEPGFEGMAINVESPRGDYRIAESEVFATPRPGRLVSDRDGTRVYRLGGRAREYTVRGVTPFSHGAETTVIRIQGAALTGGSRDAEIYRRIRLTDPSSQHCTRTFTYSWQGLGSE